MTSVNNLIYVSIFLLVYLIFLLELLNMFGDSNLILISDVDQDT